MVMQKAGLTGNWRLLSWKGRSVSDGDSRILGMRRVDPARSPPSMVACSRLFVMDVRRYLVPLQWPWRGSRLRRSITGVFSWGADNSFMLDVLVNEYKADKMEISEKVERKKKTA
jgi:hypothetical protein